MHTGPLSSLPLPADIGTLDPNDPRAEALLARWDELPEDLLAALGEHPVLGPRLEELQAAERWLGRGLAARRGEEASWPSPEDLFDASGAPGRLPLPLDRRRAVAQHLESHPEEAEWVEALRAHPPSPLLDAPERERTLQAVTANEVGAPALHDVPAPPSEPWWSRWAPLAAAAAVLAIGVVAVGERDRSDVLPHALEMRGVLDEPLHYPRGRVLAAPTDSVGLFASAPCFDFAEAPGASAYRVELRTAPLALDDPGEVLWSREVDGPGFSAAALAPGAYSWETWSVVDGLEQSLGTLDFRVVPDAARLSNLSRLDLREQVRALFQDGWATDARHRARHLGEDDPLRRSLSVGPGR